ncbi:MAG: hypothetical protein ACF8Q5_02690 [Phycisphaerales bacterium JB040]
MPSRFLCAAIAAFAACCCTLAPTAHAQTFTYQGVLEYDGAMPSLIDVRLAFYDGEGQLAEEFDSTTITNVPVGEDGVFTLDYTIDVSAYETDGPVWIQLGLREAGGTQFETMFPRQRQTFAPRAGYASLAGRAEVAEVSLDHPWLESGGVLSYGSGSDRVAINRGVLQSSTEIFGLHRETGSLPAGMYITTLAGGRPFYGYGVLGSAAGRTFHEFDTVTGVWTLELIGTPELTVDSDGARADSFTAGAFPFDAPQERTLNLSKWDFHTDGYYFNTEVERLINDDGVTVLLFSPVPITAPLRLPAGATITGVDWGMATSADEALLLDLVETDPVTDTITASINIDFRSATGSYSAGGIGLTVRDDRAYTLRVTPTPYWPDPNGPERLYFRGARVIYTVDRAD